MVSKDELGIQAIGFFFWMPLIYGIIITYLLFITIMLIFGSSKYNTWWRLAYVILFITGSYIMISYRYNDFIQYVTTDIPIDYAIDVPIDYAMDLSTDSAIGNIPNVLGNNPPTKKHIIRIKKSN